MTNPSLAQAIIITVRDGAGVGSALADALQPRPDSALTRQTSPFELSLHKYGITDRVAAVDLVQFVDAAGSPQVSLLLLPNYEPPVAACAIKEILTSICEQSFSNQPTIIVPLIVEALKSNRDMMTQTISDQEVTLYGVEIGPTNELSQAIIARSAAAPLSLRIPYEPLACLVQMIRVLNLSTVFLIASSGQGQHNKGSDHELEAVCTVGQSLANHVGLHFSKDRLQQEEFVKPKADQEPWRALYG